MWTVIFVLAILANAGSFIVEPPEDETVKNYKNGRALLTTEQEEFLMELLAADDALIEATSRGIVDDFLAALAGINQVSVVGPPNSPQPQQQQQQVPVSASQFSQPPNNPSLPTGAADANQMTVQQQAVFTAMMSSLASPSSPDSAQAPGQIQSQPHQIQSQSQPFSPGLVQSQSQQFSPGSAQSQSPPFSPGTNQFQSPSFAPGPSQSQSPPFAPGGAAQSQSPPFAPGTTQFQSPSFAPGPSQSQSPQFSSGTSQSQSSPFAPGTTQFQPPSFGTGSVQSQSDPFAPSQSQGPSFTSGSAQIQTPSYSPVQRPTQQQQSQPFAQIQQGGAPGAPIPTMTQNPTGTTNSSNTLVGGNNNHLFSTIQSVIMGSSSRNVTQIVDQSLRIATPGPIRDLVTGIFNVVYCNSVRRVMGRC